MGWKKTFVNDVSAKGLIYKIYKQLYNSITKNKKPNQKMS